MRTKRAANRLPVYVLGALVVIAIIIRIISPKEVLLPGPLGSMPSWKSARADGKMGSWAVNPSGTMWAGAWNKTGKDGKLQSAVWVIDFTKATDNKQMLKSGSQVKSLTWLDDNTLLAASEIHSGNQKLSDPATTQLLEISATGSAPKEINSSTAGIEQILAHATGSANVLAAIHTTGAPLNVAVVADNGKAAIIGKPVPTDVQYVKPGETSNWGFGMSALAPAGNNVVYAETAEKTSYFLGDTTTGTSKPAFTSDQIDGRIEGMWVSPAGILILCRKADVFTERVYDAKTGKLSQVGKDGFKVDVKTNWPDAPKEMMFVTYRGGFSYDLATATSKQIFNYSNLSYSDDEWRQEVQEGRLYPRKDGGYTSVSYSAGTIDIRVLDKKGMLDRDLLPR